MPNPETSCRLYLISPAKINLDEFAPRLEAALGVGDVAAFQLRLKPADDEEIYQAAETLLPICHKFHVPLILNDSMDLARDVGADGVHLGQSDGSVAEARAKLGLDAMIGVTCHNSRHLAFLAGDAGADYVAFGAFFPTKTKATEFTAKPELLEWWSDISEVPVVAIGGIIPENCLALITAGAHFLAVSSGVWDHPGGPGEAVKAFNKLMARHSPG
ncbi:MAG: thiamine phosphate synthase [Sphingomonadales bacterium]